MDNNNNQTIITLLHIANSLNRTVPIPLLLLGTIGNLLNIFVLTRKSLEKNSCAFYFLSSAFSNLGCLWFGLFIRLLSGYDLDPTTWNSIICKFRFYAIYISLVLSSFFLLYASIDRWASSSSNVGIRQFSRIHVARRIVFFTILFSFLFYLEIFYCFSTVVNQFPMNCYCPNSSCRIFNDLQFLILCSLIPSIVMLCFGYQTIKNVKKIHQQVRSSTNQIGSMKKKDQQMMMMLFAQVIFFFICITPSALSKCYTTLTLNTNKDSLELAKEQFLFQLSSLILYINCSSAFYIYTLTGRRFRREVKRIVSNIHRPTTTIIASNSPVIQQNRVHVVYKRN